MTNDNLNISKFGLGTVQFGIDYGFTRKKNQKEVNEILSTAVDNNITLIDTAREYGDSEEKIGNFMQNYDNQFIIATKLKIIKNIRDITEKDLRKNIYDSVTESLDNLKIDRIPILQLHQVDEYLYRNNNFWNIIHDLKKEKLIDKFGVSVYEISETEYILNNKNEFVDYFQVPFNIFDRRFEDLHDKLESKNIGLISRSTFLKGIIPCEIEKVPSELKSIIPYKIKLQNLADKLAITAEELATVFVFYNNFINSTIFGVDSSQELENNINSINKINEKDFALIDFDEFKISDLNLIDPRKWPNF